MIRRKEERTEDREEEGIQRRSGVERSEGTGGKQREEEWRRELREGEERSKEEELSQAKN